MNAHKAHTLNAMTLVIMGAWGFYAAGFTPKPAYTALIPVAMGALLLVFSNGVKSENKAQAHVAVIITLLALVAIIMKPLQSALSSDDILKKFRVIAMVATGIIAMIFFVKSFIDAAKARKAREASNS